MPHMLDMPARGTNVRSASLRKQGKDGTSFTPTEKRKRDKCLRQFARQNKGYGVAISEEYRNNYDCIDWGSGATPEELESILGGKKK